MTESSVPTTVWKGGKVSVLGTYMYNIFGHKNKYPHTEGILLIVQHRESHSAYILTSYLHHG